MADHELLQSQRNEVFEFVQSAGFDPADFSFGQVIRPGTYDDLTPRLLHNPSGYQFLFLRTPAGWHACEYSPGKDKTVEWGITGDWATFRLNVAEWLSNLRRETSEPDLWSEVGRERELLDATAEAGNLPFTEEEQVMIAEELGKIRAFLIEHHELSSVELSQLDERLKELEAAARAQGRRDWLMMLIGTLFTQAVTFGLSSEVARGLFRLAGHGLAHLFGGGIPGLPAP